MRDLVIWFKTNFLVKRNLFKSKNENFLIGNKKTFLLAKIDINESVIKIVKIISKILLEKYLNFNKNTAITKMQLILFKFKYFSSRILDIIFTIFITDSLISIFANRNFFLFPVRKFSFLLLNNSFFIRRLVLNQMTKSLIYSRIK